ncbi:unnamed protein product [Ciceribacter selenitireducens ATCC BAA-1503]|uniref:Uncharacterized protein n=1 Tax=Ciceribacter selenitireducens ATCC BAA-1503 TaxID=1336235 RepID=A0A376AGW2_9HYPH|nr:unnamed protein product [Ciceribacter selenitireducens ATCC BAA-1503]
MTSEPHRLRNSSNRSITLTYFPFFYDRKRIAAQGARTKI